LGLSPEALGSDGFGGAPNLIPCFNGEGSGSNAKDGVDDGPNPPDNVPKVDPPTPNPSDDDGGLEDDDDEANPNPAKSGVVVVVDDEADPNPAKSCAVGAVVVDDDPNPPPKDGGGSDVPAPNPVGAVDESVPNPPNDPNPPVLEDVPPKPVGADDCDSPNPPQPDVAPKPPEEVDENPDVGHSGSLATGCDVTLFAVVADDDLDVPLGLRADRKYCNSTVTCSSCAFIATFSSIMG
jgi:hypothetical protein